MEHVTRLNEAARTLRDPLTLAVYILRLAGRSVGESDGNQSDPAFLMEVMELREGLDELDLSRYDATDALDAMRAEVDEKCQGEIDGLNATFDDYFTNGNQEALDAVAQTVDRLRYYTRFLEELDQREETLF